MTCAHAVLIAPAETLIETGSIVAGKLALQIVEWRRASRLLDSPQCVIANAHRELWYSKYVGMSEWTVDLVQRMCVERGPLSHKRTYLRMGGLRKSRGIRRYVLAHQTKRRGKAR